MVASDDLGRHPEVLHLLRRGLDEAKLYEQQGLPIPADILAADTTLGAPMTAKDPSVAVTAFLAAQEPWKALHRGTETLRKFLDANRRRDFDASRRLDELAGIHPLMDSHPKGAALLQAKKDMQALISSKQVVDRWPDYQDAFDRAFGIYRDTYLESYSKVRDEVTQTVAAIKSGAAYLEAPAEKRDAAVGKVFGSGKVCDFPEVRVLAVATLLDAAGRRSLTSLGQTLVALPVYRAEVEAELRSLSSPPPASGEKIYEWRSSQLFGRRFETEKEIDSVIQQIAEDLKARIRDGYTIVVK